MTELLLGGASTAKIISTSRQEASTMHPVSLTKNSPTRLDRSPYKNQGRHLCLLQLTSVAGHGLPCNPYHKWVACWRLVQKVLAVEAPPAVGNSFTHSLDADVPLRLQFGIEITAKQW